MELPWAQLIVGGPVLMLCGLFFWSVIKLAPTYQKVREEDSAARVQTASALALVAQAVADSNKTRTEEIRALNHLAEVVQAIAIEQRKSQESLRIMQRVQADSTDGLTSIVQELSNRVAQLEQVSPTLLNDNGRPKANTTT
jgi:hypothetical protein